MKPEQIDELIVAVEAGEQVRIHQRGMPSITLTADDLDDLRLARALSVAFEKQSARLDEWLRQTYG